MVWKKHVQVLVEMECWDCDHWLVKVISRWYWERKSSYFEDELVANGWFSTFWEQKKSLTQWSYVNYSTQRSVYTLVVMECLGMALSHFDPRLVNGIPRWYWESPSNYFEEEVAANDFHQLRKIRKKRNFQWLVILKSYINWTCKYLDPRPVFLGLITRKMMTNTT